MGTGLMMLSISRDGGYLGDPVPYENCGASKKHRMTIGLYLQKALCFNIGSSQMIYFQPADPETEESWTWESRDPNRDALHSAVLPMA
jgi:hypothetical protein